MIVDVQIDLRGKFGAIRDQGSRPTCIAFAASDAHAAQREVPFRALSVEYAFYHAAKARATFDPRSGVGMSDILTAIESDGQPLEQGWPYLQHLPADLTNYVPPTNLGIVYRRGSEQKRAFGIIQEMLAQSRTPLIATTITNEFFLASPADPLRAPLSSPSVASHAVIAVGFGQHQNDDVTLIRNSWGDSWADHGYAWISRGYLEPRLLAIGVMNV